MTAMISSSVGGSHYVRRRIHHVVAIVRADVERVDPDALREDALLDRVATTRLPPTGYDAKYEERGVHVLPPANGSKIVAATITLSNEVGL
jgi:hypothetical protein